MGIFIVEEMYRTGEIRPEDDKDLSLTQPINRCLQMIKADRSKQMHSFLPHASRLFGSAPTGGDCLVPKLRAFSSPWPALSSWAVQVSAAAKCSQQLQCPSTALGRDQGDPEQLHRVWVNRSIIPLCLKWGTFLCLAHLREWDRHNTMPCLGPALLFCGCFFLCHCQGHIQQSPKMLV